MRPSRRRFLKGLIGAAAVGSAGLAVLERRKVRLAVEDPGRVKRFVLERLAPRLPETEPAPLGEPTRRSLSGFLEVYLPPAAADPGTVARLVAFADAEARERAGFGRALQDGLEVLGGDSGAGLFAQGSAAARDRALRARFTETGALHYVRSSGRAFLRFRHIVLPALLRELFASGAGWRTVAYRKYPGLCGDSRAYTTRPA
jgi:hypothetical protein